MTKPASRNNPREEAHRRTEFARPPYLKVIPGGKGQADVESWVLDASIADLGTALHSKQDTRRMEALEELAEREESRLAFFVVCELGVGSLQKGSLQKDWRNALIRATPRIQVTEDALRASLAESLWRCAIELKTERNKEDESVLWTAIRRYATLRPEADIGKLIEFLDEPDTDERLPRFHVVLLAIQNAFYASPPNELEVVILEKLRGRVSALARKYLDRSFLATADQRAIALSSYCAAAILGCADLVELTQQAISLREMWLLELAEQKLSPMVARWRAREGATEREPIRDALQEATRQLIQAISSNSTV